MNLGLQSNEIFQLLCEIDSPLDLKLVKEPQGTYVTWRRIWSWPDVQLSQDVTFLDRSAGSARLPNGT
jgi:hypothetical protein